MKGTKRVLPFPAEAFHPTLLHACGWSSLRVFVCSYSNMRTSSSTAWVLVAAVVVRDLKRTSSPCCFFCFFLFRPPLLFFLVSLSPPPPTRPHMVKAPPEPRSGARAPTPSPPLPSRPPARPRANTYTCECPGPLFAQRLPFFQRPRLSSLPLERCRC